MNKKSTYPALAIVSAMTVPMALQAQDLTVYGKMHYSIDYADATNLGGADDEDWATAPSRASRLGVKGTEDLGNGMKAIFKIESQVGAVLGGRNTYVGLSSDKGTLLLGRHDTPYKVATGKIGLFGDTAADSNVVMGTVQSNGGYSLSYDERRPLLAMYVSPNMNGFSIAAAVTSNSVAEAAGNDETEGASLAAMYNNGPFFAALAYETYEDGAAVFGNASGTNAAAGNNTDSDAVKIGLGYKANGFSVGFIHENIDLDDNTNGWSGGRVEFRNCTDQSIFKQYYLQEHSA